MKRIRKNLKNRISLGQRGTLSVDFIFGMVITFVIMLTLFRVSYSLVIVEIAQYIAYATSRAHLASDIDVEAQREAGLEKFKSLRNNPLWAHLFNSDFEMNKDTDDSIMKSGEAQGGDFGEYLYNKSADGSSLSGIPFIGTVINLKIGWLNMKLPFLGRTSDGDQEFSTKLTAFLIREPTAKECQQFVEKRYEQILQLNSKFQSSPAAGAKQDYIPLEDNGC